MSSKLGDFRHRAIYDEAASRIEMYLVAVRPVRARLVREETKG